MTRTAIEDVELDDESVIEAGEAVTVFGIAPSGDEDKIGDLDTFDPSRASAEHLAFAWDGTCVSASISPGSRCRSHSRA